MIRGMLNAPGAEVSEAAIRTMRGGARVNLTYRMPEQRSCSSFSGFVDFESDRCRLDGQTRAGGESTPQSELFIGSTSYSLQPDGWWTYTTGPTGTRGMLHPAALLEAVIHAQTSAVTASVRVVEVGLDYGELNARADVELPPDWQSTAAVELSPSGRVARIVQQRRSRKDPNARIEIECDISEPGYVGVIEAPPPAKTIPLSQWVAASNSSGA
jgi:hypothetical protein